MKSFFSPLFFLITEESKIPEEPTKDLPGSIIISSFILENNFSTNKQYSLILIILSFSKYLIPIPPPRSNTVISKPNSLRDIICFFIFLNAISKGLIFLICDPI